MRGVSITWGTPVPGRERLALEEFASYTQWVASLKAQGKIARFEFYAPVFGRYESFSGFSIIEGTDEQIAALVDSDDFRARAQRVMTVTQGVRLDLVEVGESVAKLMMLYGTSIQKLKI